MYVAATSRASQSDKEQNSRFRTSIAVVPLEGTACKREDVLAGGQAEAAAAERGPAGRSNIQSCVCTRLAQRRPCGIARKIQCARSRYVYKGFMQARTKKRLREGAASTVYSLSRRKRVRRVWSFLGPFTFQVMVHVSSESAAKAPSYTSSPHRCVACHSPLCKSSGWKNRPSSKSTCSNASWRVSSRALATSASSSTRGRAARRAAHARAHKCQRAHAYVRTRTQTRTWAQTHTPPRAHLLARASSRARHAAHLGNCRPVRKSVRVSTRSTGRATPFHCDDSLLLVVEPRRPSARRAVGEPRHAVKPRCDAAVRERALAAPAPAQVRAQVPHGEPCRRAAARERRRRHRRPAGLEDGGGAQGSRTPRRRLHNEWSDEAAARRNPAPRRTSRSRDGVMV